MKTAPQDYWYKVGDDQHELDAAKWVKTDCESWEQLHDEIQKTGKKLAQPALVLDGINPATFK